MLHMGWNCHVSGLEEDLSVLCLCFRGGGAPSPSHSFPLQGSVVFTQLHTAGVGQLHAAGRHRGGAER